MLQRAILVLAIAAGVALAGAAAAAVQYGRALPARTLAYVAWDERGGGSMIQMIDVQHGVPVTLFTTSGRIDDLAWSPDGATLYFGLTRREAAGRDIAALDVRAGTFRWLTEGAFQNRSPDISWDGRSLAFQRFTDATNWDIFVLDLDSGQARPVFQGGGIDARPAWSPDGQSILFDMSWMTFTDDFTQIYRIDIDSASPQLLIDGAGMTPAWSPDGRRVAFASDRNGSYDLYVMNADGSGLRQLTHHPASDFAPQWSPDGRTLAFVSRRSPGWQGHIYMLNVQQALEGAARPVQVTRGNYQFAFAAWRP